MSPEERQLLTGLFDRIKGSANVPRDPEAEALITSLIKSQPYAPYFLAQAVIVQDQALQAANQRLEDLQAQVEQLQQGQGQQPGGGGFLNSLGSIFGGGPSAAPPPPPRPAQPLPGGPWGQESQATQAPRGYPPQQSYSPQGAPWGGPPPGGGGFLSGALQSAAGVAGGVLLADSIRNLFGGHAGGFGGLGIGSGLGGLGGLGTTVPGVGTGGETIVNNYYDDTGRDNANDADFYDDSNSNSDDFSNNDDGSFDV